MQNKTARAQTEFGKPLSTMQAQAVRNAVNRGVDKHAIMRDYGISADTLRRVLNCTGRYAQNAPGAVPATLRVLQATNAALPAVQQLHAPYAARRQKLLKQIADLDTAYYADIEDAVKHACRLNSAPFVEVYNNVMGKVGRIDERRALAPMQVQAIRAALESGVSGNKLAVQYGVSAMAISRLRNCKTYKT